MRGICVLALVALTACTTGSSRSAADQSDARFLPSGTARSASMPISHVVIIVQENRTVDNLFNGFPNADTKPWGRMS
ncbi:MAG: hypothetical protein JO092_07925, partial [Candidatus Eremiobacteraeota bacterium]|nr:hypothetical protein [Candidatus Eremiobacteraeota bacterium]